MNRFAGVLRLSSVILGLLACQSDTTRPAAEESPGRLSDSLDRGYERLARMYDTLIDSLSTDVRQMHGAMGQMRAHMRRSGSTGPVRRCHEMADGHRTEERGPPPAGAGRRMDHSSKADNATGGQRREWHQQMMGMHAEMARLHDRAGRSGLAVRHRRMRRRHRRMGRAQSDAGTESAPEPSSSGAVSDGASQGGQLNTQYCASCHGRDGEGIGTFPPLVRSSWVAGPADDVVRILLHGLQGDVSVRGRTYDGLAACLHRGAPQ